MNNRTVGECLRALLPTGGRLEEVAALKWANVDFQWRKQTIAKLVEATCVILPHPYLAQQIATLSRIYEFVFASTSKASRIADTRASYAKALQSDGIDSLAVHELRHSFSLLGESAGAAAGAAAQVTGNQPSAFAEV